MGGYLKCVDADNPNKYVLIADGDIRFYEDANGSPQLTTAITQLGLYNIKNGNTVTTNEQFTTKYGEPAAFVSPKYINTFNVDAIESDQELNIDSPIITIGSDGRANVTVSGRLSGAGGGGVVVPQIGHRIYYKHYSGNSFADDWLAGTAEDNFYESYSAEYAVPVVSARGAEVCVRLFGVAGYGWGDSSGAASWEYSIKAGMGDGSSAFSFGEAVTGAKPMDDAAIYLYATAGGGTGTHAHIKLECQASRKSFQSGTDAYVRWLSHAALPPEYRFMPVAVKCTYADDNNISASDDWLFTALVVGR